MKKPERKSYPETKFDLSDFEDLSRIKEYLDSLSRIVILKNSDSEKFSEGGGMCRLVLKIEIEEEWE